MTMSSPPKEDGEAAKSGLHWRGHDARHAWGGRAVIALALTTISLGLFSVWGTKTLGTTTQVLSLASILAGLGVAFSASGRGLATSPDLTAA